MGAANSSVLHYHFPETHSPCHCPGLGGLSQHCCSDTVDTEGLELVAPNTTDRRRTECIPESVSSRKKESFLDFLSKPGQTGITLARGIVQLPAKFKSYLVSLPGWRHWDSARTCLPKPGTSTDLEPNFPTPHFPPGPGISISKVFQIVTCS